MITKYTLLILCVTTSMHILAQDEYDFSHSFEDGFSLSGYGSDIQLEGRLQYDWVNFKNFSAASQNDSFSRNSDHFVRRGNIGLSGTLINAIPYEARIAYDRKEHEWNFDRAWFGYSGWRWADIYFGRMKSNWGLEGTTSSSWITSTERPIMYDLTSGRDDLDYGYTIQTSGANYGFSASAAKLLYDDGDEQINKNFGYYSRLTFAPILTSNHLLHIGVDYHDANPDKNDTKIATRLETRTDEDDKLRFAEVNNTTTDHEHAFELAYQYNSLRFQSEYFSRSIKGEKIETSKKGIVTVSPQDVKLSGAYAQVSYLIGSSRKYNVAEGKWGKPNQFNTWEPFIRYEYSDIEPNKAASKKQMNNNIDGIVAMDRDDKYTVKSAVLGANYYLNENLSFKIAYSHSKISNIDTSQIVNGRHVKDTNESLVARMQFVF